jgi:hypothetical protein
MLPDGGVTNPTTHLDHAQSTARPKMPFLAESLL